MSRSRKTIMLWMLLSVLAAVCAHPAQSRELLRDGGFELGIVDVDILRYPRYGATAASLPVTPPFRDATNPISGRYSLRLPGLPTGGYHLDYPALALKRGETYQLSLDARVARDRARLKIEVFNGWTKVAVRTAKLEKGLQHLRLTFTARGAKGLNEDDAVLFSRIWVSGPADVWLDNVSLSGPAGDAASMGPARIWLAPDRGLAIYPVGVEGHFVLDAADACAGCSTHYAITDPITSRTIRTGTFSPRENDGAWTARVPLDVSKRGFYWVTAYVQDQQHRRLETVRRSYVVINRSDPPGANESRFGMCVEEHGPITQIDALVSPADYYGLLRDIGVGSVRVFSLLMPDIVSTDGAHFDFSQADAAISLMRAYGLEPMIELGSNQLYRLPAWLRTAEPGSATIDLRKGMSVRKQREKLERRFKNEYYLMLDKYRDYLHAVFSHFRGRVRYYEVWNEPGHKFDAKDFIRIAAATREVSEAVDPDAVLIGYSSTRKGQVGAGREPDAVPRFSEEMQRLGGLRYIDILSYHSEHAYPFMHGVIGLHDYETGYVGRLRKILARDSRQTMPIWDTERGMPWVSPHAERIHYMAGAPHWKYQRPSEEVLDVARQLPMIYAAAVSSGVDRLFWFNFNSPVGSIFNVSRRNVLFDAQREPMPQIPVYDAMTEVLRRAAFQKLIESEDGGRAYVFKKEAGLVVLAYNWKNKTNTLRISGLVESNMSVLDVMGNLVGKKSGLATTSIAVDVDKWPRYILVPTAKKVQVTLESR